MHSQDVIGDEAVSFLVNVISDNEEQVETREEGVWECYILVWILMNVILEHQWYISSLS
jgi:hypothetical protein